jgi:hypothetical protein
MACLRNRRCALLKQHRQLSYEELAFHLEDSASFRLKRHRRFKSHFTPTSSSWMNLVERFFADLTEDVIRTGGFSSVSELVRDIEAYLAERNANPRPYPPSF